MDRILASMRRIDDRRGAVRVEDGYATDIADLWSAITAPDRLARWIVTVEGDLRVGGIVRMRFTSAWEGLGRIDVCDAPGHLAVTLDPGTDDESVVEALLALEGSRTRLVVEERGLPLDELYLHAAGWQAHLEDLLHHLALGKPWSCSCNPRSDQSCVPRCAVRLVQHKPSGATVRGEQAAMLSTLELVGRKEIQ